MIYHLADYKFRITIEDGKRMVQCDYPSYNLKTLEGVKALKNDMDNIFSYCKDMYDDANIMLLEIQKQGIYKSKAQNESSSTLVQ